MTEQEAQAELMILRGLASSGNDLALVSERIDRLYFAVCGKHLRKCRCKDKYRDALLEIYAKMMYHKKTNTKMANTKARLVNGVVLQWKGNHYTNANLTDKVAKEFLETFPKRSDWFAELPEPQESVVDTPEIAQETAQEDTKAVKGVTTSKKKKNAKKRK